MKKLKVFESAINCRLHFLLLLVTCILHPVSAFCAFEEKIPSARIGALGGASAGLANDSSLIFYNPAGLGQLSGANFSFSQTSLFNISDLSYLVIAGAVPTKNLGTLGFGYTQFGPSIYKETELLFSHSFPLARKFLFGYNLRSQSVNIKNFGSAGALGVDLGVYSNVLGNLVTGFSVKNINNPTLGSTTEALPQNYRVGLAYYPAVGVIFLLDISKDLLSDELSYHAGGDINVTKNFAFRSGVMTNPSRFSVGFGFNFKVFRLNYALLTHPVLDAQHFVSLGVRFGPEEADVAPIERPGRRPRRTTTRRTTKLDKLEALKGLKVNINKATVEEFKEIPGIGALTAQRIVDYREEKGQFSSIDDLLGVPRLTKRTLEKIRPYLTLDVADAVADPSGSERREKKEEKIEPQRVTPKVTPQEDDDLPDEPEEETSVPAPLPVTPQQKTAPQKFEQPLVPVRPAPVVEEKKLEPTPVVDEDLLDINSASEKELEVVGFTSTQAKNIVRFRKKSGNFSSVDDLLKVPGVDARTLEKVRELIIVR